jgi:hypothetical protein
MPQSSTLDIELDVHQETIAVASVAKGHDAEGIDLGSHSNACSEPRPIAGATQERRPLGVGSSAGLGAARVSRPAFPPAPWLQVLDTPGNLLQLPL